jgi:hypothetical protein
MAEFDTQIDVTRESLSLLCRRDIPLDEWMLISSLANTSSSLSEPGTQHFWNSVDNTFGVYLVSTIGFCELQAYMVASKKYLSKHLWKKLVDSQAISQEACIEKYGKENYLGDMMSDLLNDMY